MTTEEIRDLIQVVIETGIAELEVERGDGRVRIKGPGPRRKEVVVPVPVSVATPVTPAETSPAQASAKEPPAPAPPSTADHEELIKSPIVGTYYDSPSPGAPPFVKVGDRIEAKQVVCIIESMKLMNEIEAETGGILVAKHVENGRPVEYGEALFTLRTN